jgi:hypothetical protein
MENLRGPDRGESVIAEGSTGFEGPEGPARVGPTLKRPDRLEEGDLLVAVSQAVLRELEGGAVLADLQQSWHTMGIWPVDPVPQDIRMSVVPPI